MSKYKNITDSESACHCGCGYNKLDPLLVKVFNKIREIVGAPITITCACRCEQHNTAVGGAEHSRHLPNNNGECEAMDLAIPNGWTEEQFADVCDDVLSTIGGGGLGRYLNSNKNIIHIDVRTGKARWMQ